jgi:hypothetical protein
MLLNIIFNSFEWQRKIKLKKKKVNQVKKNINNTESSCNFLEKYKVKYPGTIRRLIYS